MVEASEPEPHPDRLVTFNLRRRGSRHRAAASYAWRNPGALVFVASEDGGTRCLLRQAQQEVVTLWRCRPVGRIGVPEGLRRRI